MDLIDRLREYASTRKGKLAELITEAADALERQTCEDAVSRQQAIDALAEQMPQSFTPDGSHPADEGIFRAQEIYADCIQTLKELPAVQPDRPFEIQDILDYLDTVLHPIISPEHWNVYSELHDMISALPSATQQKPLKYSGNGSICCHCKTQDCTGCLYEPMMCKE